MKDMKIKFVEIHPELATVPQEDLLRTFAELHGRDGLPRATREGYPFQERAKTQIEERFYEALRPLLPEGATILPYEEWEDWKQHSAPNQRSFDLLDETIAAVRRLDLSVLFEDVHLVAGDTDENPLVYRIKTHARGFVAGYIFIVSVGGEQLFSPTIIFD